MSMTVIVNGESRLTEAQHVAGLIAELGLSGNAVAVELNGRIIPRAEHAQSLLASDDRLEIVSFVGGG